MRSAREGPVSSSLPQFGKYQVTDVLGRGGMGVVYLAQHPQLGFEVAIKVLLAGSNSRPAQLERFRRELQALTQLKHPGLVDVLEAGEREGRPWFAMRRVLGVDLEERLQTRGALSPSEVVELGVQLSSAIGHAHQRGLLHRDLKPANVLCGPDERYVVTDFGLTKNLEFESQSLSQTGTIQGTPGYWAPEQARGEGKEASPPTDVYGVGAILYAALTGEPPIKGEGMFEVVVATCDRPPVPPSQLAAVPKPLEAVVLKCLAKSPDDRFQSLDELGLELERVRERIAAKPRSPWVWALGGLGVMGAGALAAGLSLGLRDATPADSGQSSEPPSPTTLASAKTPAPTPPPATPTAALEIAALRRAAEAGQTEAMFALAEIYARGERVPRDVAEAKRWLERGAEAGDTRAMVGLGIRLLAEEESALALEQFRRAAVAGDAKGMGRLGVCYLTLPGLDRALGVKWLRRGAAAGDTRAMVNLGLALDRGRGVAADPAGAIPWFREAAARGDSQGMAKLAAAFAGGRGVPKDEARAIHWCREGAKAGDTEAMVYLGESYVRGLGVEQDFAEAILWFRRAAREGQAAGYGCLGELYLEGRGVPQDLNEAVRLFGLGAAGGHPTSLTYLGTLYVEGRGVEQDVQRGLALLRRAVDKRHPLGRWSLAVILFNGAVMQRDVASARRLFESVNGSYAALFVFLCQAEQEGLPAARAQLRAFAIEERPTGWPGALVELFLDESSDEALLRAAAEGIPHERRERLCEANFYAGALRALRGEFERAKPLLRACVANRVDGFEEVSAAEALLDRIEGRRAPR